jgi:hypothetical protein
MYTNSALSHGDSRKGVTVMNPKNLTLLWDELDFALNQYWHICWDQGPTGRCGYVEVSSSLGTMRLRMPDSLLKIIERGLGPENGNGHANAKPAGDQQN